MNETPNPISYGLPGSESNLNGDKNGNANGSPTTGHDGYFLINWIYESILTKNPLGLQLVTKYKDNEIFYNGGFGWWFKFIKLLAITFDGLFVLIIYLAIIVLVFGLILLFVRGLGIVEWIVEIRQKF
ncbi:MAG: hypothetical protein OHK0017_08100 [Patescibacteria group bacterium]